MAGSVTQTTVEVEVVRTSLKPDQLHTVVDSETVVFTILGVAGQRGLPGQGVAETYVHVQDTPAAEWTINHDLDRWPSVTVVDSAGSVVIGYQQYTSSNQVRLEFSAPFSGRAYLN